MLIPDPNGAWEIENDVVGNMPDGPPYTNTREADVCRVEESMVI